MLVPMKALSLFEFQNLFAAFDDLLPGSQLQEILPTSQGVCLGFHKNQRYWLVLDLNNNSPMVLIFQDQIPLTKSTQKPLSLFLNSHAKNLYFDHCEVDKTLGRVGTFYLENKSGDSFQIELQFIPRQVNVILRAGKKSVSWVKPQDLAPMTMSDDQIQIEQNLLRTNEEIHQQWIQEFENKTSPNRKDPFVEWAKKTEKELQKKNKAILELKEQIENIKDSQWRNAGEWIKSNGNLKVPLEFMPLIQTNENLSWNIENCFHKAKQEELKLGGRIHRLELLQAEVLSLSTKTFQQAEKTKKTQTVRKTNSQRQLGGDLRARKLPLSTGGHAYLGKSAKDNIDLLRKAKSWDYWLHLKDYPSAHAIIQREKTQKIPFNDLSHVAQWLAKESLSQKSLLVGQKLEVVWTECRFVKPIKGDKLGRVQYHSEHHFSIDYK